jgi:putative ABC transport system permease protein
MYCHPSLWSGWQAVHFQPSNIMNKMIIANLVRRPLRSLISIVAIALEVTLILLIVGLCYGIMNDSRQRQAGMGADAVVMPAGSTVIQGVSGAPLFLKLGDILSKLPHVEVVAPVVMVFSAAGTLEIIYGIDVQSFERLGGPFHYLEGGPFQAPEDVLVDDIFAKGQNKRVGDTIDILNNSFRIAGIVEHGRGARKFLQMSTLQEMIGAHGKCSAFYLKLDDANNAAAVVSEIKSVPGMEQYNVRSMQEYLSLMTPTSYPYLSTFINVVIGVSVTIGLIVIFQAMYTAVMERTREIGILKSIGASKLYIVNVILCETTLLAVAGIVAGIAFSLLAQKALGYKMPLVKIEVSGGWMLRAAGIAILGSLAGAVYPALKAAQKDPIEALAYE